MNRVPERHPAPTLEDQRRGRAIFAGLCGLGAALGALLYLLPRPLALHLLDERGPMEMFSLGVYGLDILFLLWLLPRRPGLMGWSLAAVALLAVFEINPGNRLSEWIEAQPAIPGDPVGVHLIGVLCISGIVLAVLVGLVLSARGSFFRGLRDGVPDVRLAAVGGAFQVIAFFIDRIQASRFNWHRGYRLERGIFYASDVVEETLEFLMPFFFFFAILLWSRRPKTPPREVVS